NASAAWEDMEGTNITSSITLGMSRDSRNEPWDTSKGSYNSLSFEFAGRALSGDVSFNKVRLTSAWYFPLFWNTVFLVKGNWGYIEERAGGKLPVYHKFRIGGLSSVRGFEAGHISPTTTVTWIDWVDDDLDPVTPDVPITRTRTDRIGGERMMYYNLEYRFPILKEQGITGLVFFDCGNVFEDYEHYTFSGIRKSAGVGIRWYSPMGPLRLEYGKNLDPVEGEKSGKWEFSMGNQF
ncbi:MAG: BamA/TamA family outer membrane protein, partial [Desulfobacterales bacterium]|nr:BamA/TamA family outer membrane protein [Desulfobacterales bacterium]